jgi:hypothetical protein
VDDNWHFGLFPPGILSTSSGEETRTRCHARLLPLDLEYFTRRGKKIELRQAPGTPQRSALAVRFRSFLIPRGKTPGF